MPNSSTILLVDDEDSIQTLLTFPLERDGYRVVQARDGEEALRRFGEEASIPEGFGDLSRSEARFLTLALAGVLARHRRPSGPKGKRTARTTGSLALAGGAEGRYTVTDLS